MRKEERGRRGKLCTYKTVRNNNNNNNNQILKKLTSYNIIVLNDFANSFSEAYNDQLLYDHWYLIHLSLESL